MATSDDTPKVTSKSGADNLGPGFPSEITDEILKFLATAPPEIEQWANARAAAVQDGSDEALNATTSDPVSEATEPDPQLALAELGEDPDDSPGIALSTPASRPARPHPQGKRALSGAAKAIIAIVLVVVVGFGVYTIGDFGSTAANEDPMNPHDEAAMAEFEAQRQRLGELKEYVQENPDSVDGHLELGLLQFNLGAIEDAKQTWLTVTELDPEEVQAWYNLGFAYMAQDEPDMKAAKEAWQKVIDMEPDSPLAETVLNHMSALNDGETN